MLATVDPVSMSSLRKVATLLSRYQMIKTVTADVDHMVRVEILQAGPPRADINSEVRFWELPVMF